MPQIDYRVTEDLLRSTKLLLAGAATSVVLLAAPAVAPAATTCDVGSGLLEVQMPAADDDALLYVTGTGEIQVSRGEAQVICTGVGGPPTVSNTIAVDVDRPGFVLNPTSCADRRIAATIDGADGARHAAAARFELGGCPALPFRPKLRLQLLGRRQMREGGHPGVRAVLTQRAGQANLRKAAVKLPLSLALDPENARGLCAFADAGKADPTCPRSSIIGRAVAHTPILDRPLDGPVYFAENVRIHPRTGRRIRTLPSLVIPLRGEVAINLRAQTSVSRGRLVSTFDTVPDVPVSRFELRLEGGRFGVLVATRDVCDRPRGDVADLQLDGHNRKRSDRRLRLVTACKKKGRGSAVQIR